MTDTNRYLDAIKPDLDAEWLQWLSTHNPVTKDNWTGGGTTVWKTISDGRGGTIQVRSGGVEDQAYKAIRSKWHDVAAQNSWNDRLAAGWTEVEDPNTGKKMLLDPQGDPYGSVAGMRYGRYAYPEGPYGGNAMWGDQLSNQPGSGGRNNSAAQSPSSGPVGGVSGSSTFGTPSRPAPTQNPYQPLRDPVASPFSVPGSFTPDMSGFNLYGDPEVPTPPGPGGGIPGNPMPIPEGQEPMTFRPYGEPVGVFSQQRSYAGLPRSTGPWGEMGGYYGGNPFVPDVPDLPQYQQPGLNEFGGFGTGVFSGTFNRTPPTYKPPSFGDFMPEDGTRPQTGVSPGSGGSYWDNYGGPDYDFSDPATSPKVDQDNTFPMDPPPSDGPVTQPSVTYVGPATYPGIPLAPSNPIYSKDPPTTIPGPTNPGYDLQSFEAVLASALQAM